MNSGQSQPHITLVSETNGLILLTVFLEQVFWFFLSSEYLKWQQKGSSQKDQRLQRLIRMIESLMLYSSGFLDCNCTLKLVDLTIKERIVNTVVL